MDWGAGLGGRPACGNSSFTPSLTPTVRLVRPSACPWCAPASQLLLPGSSPRVLAALVIVAAAAHGVPVTVLIRVRDKGRG